MSSGSEFDLIRRFLVPAAPARSDVRVEVGDDCAVVAGNGIALSTDMSVEDVHFRREWLAMREIGFRAVSAALSDLAAVAARPIGALVSLALPPSDAGDGAVELMEGARAALAEVGGVLLGGDVSRTNSGLVIDVAVVGECAAPVLRSGAERGDEVWVTGELGASALLVERMRAGLPAPPAARARFAAPTPRIDAALWLRARQLPKAMIDLSDGLAGDAAHLSAASGVAILLAQQMIPVAGVVREEASPRDALRLAVAGGEDYELCFVAAVGAVEPHVSQFESELGLRLTCIGRVGEGSGVWWVDEYANRHPVTDLAFQHFSEGA